MKISRAEDGAVFSATSVEEQLAIHFMENKRLFDELKHPFVVTPQSCYQTGEFFFMMRPYTEGTPLRILSSELRLDPTLSNTKKIIAELVAGIEYLHSKDFLCV